MSLGLINRPNFFSQDLLSHLLFSNIFVFGFMSFLGVLIRFKSSEYIAIFTNLVYDFLIKMHRHIGLFAYSSFNKYSLRRLYYMHPD